MLQQQLSQVFLQSFHNWPIYLQVCALHRCFQHWSQNTLLYLSEQAVYYLYCSFLQTSFVMHVFSISLSFLSFFRKSQQWRTFTRRYVLPWKRLSSVLVSFVYSYFFYSFIYTCKLVLELEMSYFESKYVIHVNRVDLVCVCGGGVCGWIASSINLTRIGTGLISHKLEWDYTLLLPRSYVTEHCRTSVQAKWQYGVHMNR